MVKTKIHINEIPILEFDPEKAAVIMPDHEHIGVRLPQRAVFAFLGDEIDAYAKEHGARVAVEFETATKVFPVYILRHEGQEICLAQAPTGAAPAAQFLDWLIGYGAREIVSAGSCGALEDIAENTFLVPYKALRDEGTGYHYAAPSRFIEIDTPARVRIKAVLEKHGLPYREVITWTTEGFYRETPDKVAYRRSEGCAVVEMECSALAACARLRGVSWGESFSLRTALQTWRDTTSAGGAGIPLPTRCACAWTRPLPCDTGTALSEFRKIKRKLPARSLL